MYKLYTLYDREGKGKLWESELIVEYAPSVPSRSLSDKGGHTHIFPVVIVVNKELQLMIGREALVYDDVY